MFSDQLHRDIPDLYTVPFVVKTWRRENVIFEIIYEGVRLLIPRMIGADYRSDLGRAALSDGDIAESRCGSPRELGRFGREKAIWRRTAIPLNKSEYKGFGLKTPPGGLRIRLKRKRVRARMSST